MPRVIMLFLFYYSTDYPKKCITITSDKSFSFKIPEKDALIASKCTKSKGGI